MVLDWINKNLLVTVAGDEIIFPIDSTVNILTPLSAFTGFFGEAITTALNGGTDVKESIRNSDPENVLGFNDYI